MSATRRGGCALPSRLLRRSRRQPSLAVRYPNAPRRLPAPHRPTRSRPVQRARQGRALPPLPTAAAEPLPAILTRPEGRLKAFASIAGISSGLLVSLAVMLLASRESMVGRMFDWRNPGTLIPVSIWCMFFWGSFACWLRFRRLRAMEPLCRKSLLLQITQGLSAAGIDQTARELDGVRVSASPLLRRVQAVLRQWQILPGMAETDIVLQQHISSDEEEIHAGYSLVRTFVWALPVLGLIGTVIGISLAVGGFALFLGTGIDDVSLIKKNLVGVTGGLSFAFLITLQGLLTSLLLMLAASALQTRERRLHAELQQNIVDLFLPAVQRVAPAADWDAGGRSAAAREETAAQAARAMLDKVQQSAEEQMAAVRGAGPDGTDGSCHGAPGIRASAERP